jgi:acetoin utilization deacetylase AcuC-like enzyme
MNIIYHPIFLEHDTGGHPENRKRLESLGPLSSIEIPSGEKYLSLIHTAEYIEHVKLSCKLGEKLDNDTLVSSRSYEAATYAVGATIYASQINGFAVVRPPGHHAYPDHSGGFCIFNNMAIAVRKLGIEGKRVMIIDIDSHLGDGTEKIFYESADVLYASIHQDPSYPGGGTVNDIGYKNGLGYTVNIPIPVGSGDDIFLEGLKMINSIGIQFEPDIVGVSAGFDGHLGDSLLNLRLSNNAYYLTGKNIRHTFNNIFATLEGGYNLEIFPKCLYCFLAGVNGETIPFSEDQTESTILTMEEFLAQQSELKKNLSPYWKL